MKRYVKFSSVDGRKTLNDWIAEHSPEDYSNIMVICTTPYEDIPDDCPGVLYDGKYTDLAQGKGDNSMINFWRDVSDEEIRDEYSKWVVTQEKEVQGNSIDLYVDWVG